MAIPHFEFVFAIESGNTFEASDQVGRSDSPVPADDMTKLATDLSSSQAPAQPNLILNSGCPSKLDSAQLGIHLHAYQLDFAAIACGFQATVLEFAKQAEPPASSE